MTAQQPTRELLEAAETWLLRYDELTARQDDLLRGKANDAGCETMQYVAHLFCSALRHSTQALASAERDAEIGRRAIEWKLASIAFDDAGVPPAEHPVSVKMSDTYLAFIASVDEAAQRKDGAA